ncbi:MAG: hypothetical protein HYY85_15300 [Deltaproteobacteria bacterium]|nr:hypothetical protein [Deltaproteobacteria bacterium]
METRVGVDGRMWPPLEALSQLLRGEAPPGPVVLLYGETRLLRLGLELCFRLLARGEPVVLVDGGNSFDPYLLTRLAQEVELDPRALLERIHVSRTFTCHQLQALILDAVEPALTRVHGRALVCSGLLETLYDEDVPTPEVWRIFRRIEARLQELARRGHAVLLLCPWPPAGVRGRDGFIPALADQADYVLRVAQGQLTLEKPPGQCWPLPEGGWPLTLGPAFRPWQTQPLSPDRPFRMRRAMLESAAASSLPVRSGVSRDRGASGSRGRAPEPPQPKRRWPDTRGHRGGPGRGA